MSDEIDFHLGKRMRRRRRLLGLTQQQLANACGVRFQQIQKYECGANRVSAGRLWLIAGALEVPVGYFFDGLAEAPEVVAAREEADVIHTYRRVVDPQHRRPPGFGGARVDPDTDAA